MSTLTKARLALVLRMRLEKLADDFMKDPQLARHAGSVLHKEATCIEQVVNDWPPFENLAQRRAETVRSHSEHDGNPSAIAPRLSSKSRRKKS